MVRVLIVDDNRDGADALGLLVEELGNQVHVTYGGRQALEVASAFRPDLMLVDLVMPEVDGFNLVSRLRQDPLFAKSKIVAVTGQKGEEHTSLALTAGCNQVIFKPAGLSEIKAILAGVVPTPSADLLPSLIGIARANKGIEERLPIEKARRIRSERKSKSLTQSESEAAICDGITRFQEEYFGWRSEKLQAFFIKDILLIRIVGVLTLAERQLGRSLHPNSGRDLIKQSRKQLTEMARPMLESIVHEATGIKVKSLHHDLSTVSGEEVILFTLMEAPHFE